MIAPAIFRVLEVTAAVLLTTLVFAATNADLMAAGWLRGERATCYRIAFGVTIWAIGIALFSSPTMLIAPRIALGALGGYLSSAFAQFVVVPAVEGRSPPIYESVARFGIAPALLAPLATFGWAIGALALLLAAAADSMQRRLLHKSNE